MHLDLIVLLIDNNLAARGLVEPVSKVADHVVRDLLTLSSAKSCHLQQPCPLPPTLLTPC